MKLAIIKRNWGSDLPYEVWQGDVRRSRHLFLRTAKSMRDMWNDVA